MQAIGENATANNERQTAVVKAVLAKPTLQVGVFKGLPVLHRRK
jgi:hypothetical protein